MINSTDLAVIREFHSHQQFTNKFHCLQQITFINKILQKIKEVKPPIFENLLL